MNNSIKKERYNNLKLLAKKMNSQSPFPLPVTKHLISCFDIAISQQEAEYLNKLDTCFYTYEELLQLSSSTKKDFTVLLKNILKKGLIEYKDDKNYIIAPILVGWFEVYLAGGEESESKKLFAEAFEKYSNSRLILNHFPIRNILNIFYKNKLKPFTRIAKTAENKDTQLRTINVNKNINIDNHGIYSTKSVQELIENLPDDNEIVAIYCFCRQWKKMVNQPCKFKHNGESCIVIGNSAKAALKSELGRSVNKEEALNIINLTAKGGAVHQVFHESMKIEKPETAICNCCWDCCGALGSYNRGLSPLCTKAYFISEVENEENCIHCGQCKKYCPTNAISLIELDPIVIQERCIGCGQCKIQCSKNVFNLIPNERDVFLPILKKSEARIK
jgi:NAD-dependent dihydropyrimidine dehydrogenase PreA subunit